MAIFVAKAELQSEVVTHQGRNARQNRVVVEAGRQPISAYSKTFGYRFDGSWGSWKCRRKWAMAESSTPHS